MKLSGIQYNVVLQRMIKVLKRDIDAEIVPLIHQYTADSGIVTTVDAWSDIVAAALKRLIDRWNSPYNQRIANDIARKFVNNALERNKSFGFDVFQNSQELLDYTKAASWQNAQLIISIPSQYLTQVSNIVMGNMRQGMRPSYIVQQLQEQYGITQRRAKMIARDQTAKITGEITKLRQQQAGFKYFRWLDSHDQRVRHRHKEIADKETAYGKGVYKWTELPLSERGEPIQPGSDFQCFTGQSPVNVFYGARKLFRHWYSGELTTIVTDTGKHIVCTSNHPVLTDGGFIPANIIDVGDNLMYVPDQTIDTPNGKAYTSNIIFSKLFETGQLIGVVGKSTSTFGSDFHGDIVKDEKINIVTFDWELPCVGNVIDIQEFFKLFFSRTDQMFINVDTPTLRDFESVIQGLTLAPDSIVSSVGKLLSIVTTGFAHSDKHCFTSIGLLYTSLIENTSDHVSRSIEFFSNCFNANIGIQQQLNIFNRYMLAIVRFYFGAGNLETPGANGFANCISITSEMSCSFGNTITVDHEPVRVVDKFISEFSGHVYNLEMDRGLFVSHNFAVSNCRCTAVPVSDAAVEKFQKSKSGK